MPPHTNAEVRGTPSTLHTPNHVIRATVVSAYRPQPRYIHTTHGYQAAPWIPSCTMATSGSASASSEIEAGSICLTMQELRAAAAKQADACVAGVALHGMWRVEGVSPYVCIHIRGIGWKYGGPLIAKKTQILLKIKQRRQLADAPGLIRQKQAQCVLDHWQGSWGVFPAWF